MASGSADGVEHIIVIDEDPSIEPRCDIEAQLQAMAAQGLGGVLEDKGSHVKGDGSESGNGALGSQRKGTYAKDHDRLAVWFSRQNFIEHYRVALRYPREQILTNFDDLGGVLVTKTRKVAQECLEKKRRGIPIRSIIGSVIGAGDGKPYGPALIVQMRTETGAVVRESAVPAHTAQTVAASWGPGAVVLSIEETLARRTILHNHHSLQ